ERMSGCAHRGRPYMRSGSSRQPTPRRVFLLLGSPRSGTSWLAKVLDTYPAVWYTHEPLSKTSLQRARVLIGRLRKSPLNVAERQELVTEVCRAESQCKLPPFFPKAWRWTPAGLVTAAHLAVRFTGWGKALFGAWFTPPVEARLDLLIKEV